MVSFLHKERLDTVVEALLACGASSVLDLGCGPGELLLLLAEHQQFRRLVGIDTCLDVLQEARTQLTHHQHLPDGQRLALYQGSFTECISDLQGFDAVALIETIEHIPPGRLSLLERAVFSGYAPQTVIITTPNSEYNPLHGMAPGQFRHPDHQFEWDRQKLRRWAQGVAGRSGYQVSFSDIGEVDMRLGGSSQMAFFWRAD
ncbi:MAG TPA: methyltransferase domain-containing protein [Pelovirga sp.]|nr:methyltransferase domain-containing protein [Pelovirga sp.]